MKNLLARRRDNRARIIKLLKGKVSEEQIDRFCMKNEINPKVAETIYLYLNNSIEDVAEILEVSNATIAKRVAGFITTCEIIDMLNYTIDKSKIK